MVQPDRGARAAQVEGVAPPSPPPHAPTSALTPHGSSSRFGKRLLTTGVGLLLLTSGGLSAVTSSGVAQAAVTPTSVNEPPVNGHSMIVFTQRDFVSISGYAQDELVTVELIHPNGTTFTAGSGLIPQDDPRTTGFDGLVEVNHPGGYCWQTTTPDIRPGDRVRVTVDATGVADQTTVANVTAGRPVKIAADTVVVHGTAAQADGAQIPVAELEQRLVANRQAFDATGARTLRAASVAPPKGGGTLSYDSATGNAWTATYGGLTARRRHGARGGVARDVARQGRRSGRGVHHLRERRRHRRRPSSTLHRAAGEAPATPRQ